jgi:outer membrane protein
MTHINKITTPLLFISVGILYYLFFTSDIKKKDKASDKSQNIQSKVERPVRLAYIDLDTIEEKYLYFKQKNDELESEKKKIEAEVESGIKKLEQDRENFLKKGESITQVEAEQFQQQFQNRYQQLSERRETLFASHMESQKKAFDEIQAKINAYLEEYNKKEQFQFIFSVGAGNLTVYYKDSALNITKQVLEGLNASYQKKDK